jgi:hypothetical protein
MDEDQAAAGSAPAAAVDRVRLGYRGHARFKRERRGALRYTEAEWALIITAAVRHRMRPGAWAQQAALDAAAAEVRGAGVGRQELTELITALTEHRNALARVGGNLNQLAAFANSTGGQIPAAAAGILRQVRERVNQSDQLIARSWRLLSPTGDR